MKMFLVVFGLLMSFATTQHAFATASSVVQSSYTISLDNGERYRVVKMVLTGSSVDGTFTDVANISLHGKLVKANYKLGATPFTAATTLQLLDPDTSLDALNNTMGSLSHSASQQFFPVGATSMPLYFQPANYTLHISGNSVTSGNGTIFLYFLDNKGGLGK